MIIGEPSQHGCNDAKNRKAAFSPLNLLVSVLESYVRRCGVFLFVSSHEASAITQGESRSEREVKDRKKKLRGDDSGITRASF
jgi:hypothetical protein